MPTSPSHLTTYNQSIPVQFIHCDVNKKLSIITSREDEGMMATISRLVGRDMDELSTETFNQRWESTKEHLEDDNVEFFWESQKFYQKVEGGLRCWFFPPRTDIFFCEDLV